MKVAYFCQGISLEKNGISRASNLTYLSSVRFSRCKNNYHKSANKSNTYLFLLLLTISHVTETNPGPNDSTRYPCGTCNNSVTWEHKAICCDTCETWYHIDCQGMASHMYSIMDNPNLSWYCIQCGLPNFSTSIFDFTCIETSNRFSTLNSSVNSELNISNIGEPNATSSPPKTTHDKGKQRNKQSTKGTPLRVININFQSINNKKPELDQLIQSVKPDIILGTETLLSNETSSYEYFPNTEYTVYRKDRCCNSKEQSHGGVLIAVSKNILSQEVPELQTDCENVWVEVNLVNARKLIIGCFYRPPSDNGHALDQLRESLNRINTNAQATVLLGGDFNLGHIDWSIPAVIPGKPDHAQHISIIDIINDFSLEQIVNKPTRGERILDLILTNKPTSFNDSKILPPIGKSDHDIVFVECNISLKRQRKPTRTIFKYRQSNWDKIKIDIKEMTDNMLRNYKTKDIDQTWNYFKNTLLKTINENIPTKTITSKMKLPWITNQLRLQINRNKRLHTKCKTNRSLTAKYKSNKKGVTIRHEKSMLDIH